MIRAFFLILLFWTSVEASSQIIIQPTHEYSYRPSPCKMDERTWCLNDRITSISLQDDTLKVELNVKLNCCAFEIGFGFIHHDTLFMQADGDHQMEITPKGDTIYRSSECDCDCCFILNYSFYDVKEVPEFVFFNGNYIVLSDLKYKTDNDCME